VGGDEPQVGRRGPQGGAEFVLAHVQGFEVQALPGRLLPAELLENSTEFVGDAPARASPAGGPGRGGDHEHCGGEGGEAGHDD
jgi:hypothetical protein